MSKHHGPWRLLLYAGIAVGLALLLFQHAFLDMPSPEQLRKKLDSAFPAYEEAARICVQYPDLGRVDRSSERFVQPDMGGEVQVEPGVAKQTFRFMVDQGIETIECGRLYKDGVPHLAVVGFRFVEYRYFMTVRFIALTRIFPSEYVWHKEPIAPQDRIPEHPEWELFRSK